MRDPATVLATTNGATSSSQSIAPDPNPNYSLLFPAFLTLAHRAFANADNLEHIN
jgi:hypothetical protein